MPDRPNPDRPIPESMMTQTDLNLNSLSADVLERAPGGAIRRSFVQVVRVLELGSRDAGPSPEAARGLHVAVPELAAAG